jgi:hypothetical protein
MLVDNILHKRGKEKRRGKKLLPPQTPDIRMK